MNNSSLRVVVGALVFFILLLASCGGYTVDCRRYVYMRDESHTHDITTWCGGGPFHGMEPVDSSEAPVCAPGFPSLQVGRWCQDQGGQMGGITLTPGGSTTITSVDGNDIQCHQYATQPFSCWGPEGAAIEVTACSTCQAVSMVTRSPECPAASSY